MKYVICFKSSSYIKLDLDNMTDEERWSEAELSMGIGSYDAWITPLDEWVNQYNTGRIPESGSLYIYIVDNEGCCTENNANCLDTNISHESINKDEAWLFYDNIAKPQTNHYINDYNGDKSVFWQPEEKLFWYEAWIDLEENWVDGEQIYLMVKDMDLRKIGKFIFNKLCKYEAYYDSPAYIEDLNKMVAGVFND